MDFLSTLFAYAIGCGLFAIVFYIARLVSAFFTAVSDFLLIPVKPVISTAQRWVSAVNEKLSGSPGSGKDFVAYWFGSPLLIVFMLLITGYTGAYYFQHVASVGAESFIIELFTNSSLYSLVELTSQIGTSPDISSAEILAAGSNALLMAALTDLFISQLFPHRSNWLKEPLSYVTVTVYGLIFLAFTSVLGDLIPTELFTNTPQDWWNNTWFTLPHLPVSTGDGFGFFMLELWRHFQMLLNGAVSFGFLYALTACFFLFISNILSAFACCAFSMACVGIFSFVLNLLLPADVENFELLIAGIIVGSIVLSDVLFQTERVSDLVESTRPFRLIADAAEKLENCVEAFFDDLPISTLAILFSGITGGPCLLFSVAGVLFFLFDGFSVQTLLMAGCLFVAFLVFSIPCLVSARIRGRDKKTTIGYFVAFVCVAIPLASYFCIVNLLNRVF